MKSNKIAGIINSIDKLPTLPSVYLKLSHLLDAPDSTIKMISNIISEDQATAATVLRLVNSAFYGFPKKIGNIQRAIVILGLNEIKNLVLATSVLKITGQFKYDCGFDMEEFWRHSIGCAVSARILAETACLKRPEDVFAGGLLHDIGKLIHVTYLRDEFTGVITDVEESGLPMFESEEKILGFSHPQTGSALAEKWGLARETIDMIACHHLSDNTITMTKEIAAVHIGNTICTALRMGSGGEKRVPAANQEVWEILGIKLSRIEYVMTRAMKLFEESISIFGL